MSHSLVTSVLSLLFSSALKTNQILDFVSHNFSCLPSDLSSGV